MMIINNIKYALKGIIDNKVISLLLIIQLSICLVFFVQYLNIYKEISYKTDLALKQYNTENIYVMENQENLKEETKKVLKQKSLEQINEIKTQLEDFFKNTKEFKYLVSKDNITSMPLNEKTVNLDFKQTNLRVKNSDGIYENVNIVEVPSHTINKIYLEHFGLIVESGRVFNDEDFKIDAFVEATPIIVGSQWASYYNVGDVISIYNFIKNDYVQMKVIGILPKDVKLFLHEYTSMDLINDINKIVILPDLTSSTYDTKYKEYMEGLGIPYDEKDIQIEKILTLTDALLVFNDDLSRQDAQNTVNQKLNLYDINNIKLNTIDDKFEIQKMSTQKTMKQNQFIFVMLFLFSFIGITISFIVSVSMRLKEFAIHILNGATKKDISIRIFLELLLMLVVSMVIAIIYTNVKLYMEYINAPIVENIVYYEPSYIIPSIETVVTIILLAAISSFIPLLKLRNVDISDVIKGDE